jgi:hypothetical protein
VVDRVIPRDHGERCWSIYPLRNRGHIGVRLAGAGS